MTVTRKEDLFEMDFPAYELKQVEVTDEMIDAIGAKPLEAYMGRVLFMRDGFWGNSKAVEPKSD